MTSPDTRPQPDQQPDQHPAEIPPAKKKDEGADAHSKSGGQGGKTWPPDSIPNPMPGVDPQQTPGIDRLSPG
jgi:hypothetical protein